MSMETTLRNIKIDTELDCMFELSGILLAGGSQRLFTKIIQKLEPQPIASTFVNLGRICCSIQEASNYTPRDSMIWKSIQLECIAPGQSIVWSLTQQLWLKKYRQWPTLNWGLVLGCVIIPEKVRLFAILVSVAWHLIWNLRHERVIENPDRVHNNKEIHNDKNKFGSLAFKKLTVLNTWSCILGNEKSFPEDWLHEGDLIKKELNNIPGQSPTMV
ncbi:hypothetical protein C8R45DRAFT_926079 [Mycena sanguinolenta]|nr:hypothetical protein C8R45DRAFT_926079 [Mycena sanguinolenta]